MIDLSGYDPAHLHSCRAVLAQADVAGMDLVALRSALDARVLMPEAAPPVNPTCSPIALPSCSSCGSPAVVPALGADRRPILVDGGKIMGCRACRYSWIEEERG